jgi:hypothetical protein
MHQLAGKVLLRVHKEASKWILDLVKSEEWVEQTKKLNGLQKSGKDKRPIQ